MKRKYMKPAMTVALLQHQHPLLTGSEVTGTNGNTNLKLGGSGSGEGRSRSFGDWDDEE